MNCFITFFWTRYEGKGVLMKAHHRRPKCHRQNVADIPFLAQGFYFDTNTGDN
jgi:hypothetical protein